MQRLSGVAQENKNMQIMYNRRECQLNLTNIRQYRQNIIHLEDKTFEHMRILGLANCCIDADVCQILAHIQWNFIQSLYLDRNNIGARGCRYLSQSNWPSLLQLFLSSNSIGNEGCRSLQKGHWPKLKIMQLSDNSISNEGVHYLTTSNMNYMTLLVLNNNKQSEQSIIHLKNVGKWRSNIQTQFFTCDDLINRNIYQCFCQESWFAH